MFGQESPELPPPAPTPKPAPSLTPTPTRNSLTPSQPIAIQRKNSQRFVLPGTESEADRAERRKEAEEKAIALRDDKLVEAAGVPGQGLVLHGENVRTPGQKLTVENVGRLQMESTANGQGRGPWSEFKKSNLSAAIDSMGAERDTAERDGSERETVERPKLRRWRDSEKTV